MPVTHGVTGSSPVRTAINITQSQSFGSVAQLNRASDYGSEGYRFESCRSHSREIERLFEENGSVAQLNRASDYGSEGYRFESCRSHEGSRKTIARSFFLCIYFCFLLLLRGGWSETGIRKDERERLRSHDSSMRGEEGN